MAKAECLFQYLIPTLTSFGESSDLVVVVVVVVVETWRLGPLEKGFPSKR